MISRRGLITGALALFLAPPELHRKVWALGGFGNAFFDGDKYLCGEMTEWVPGALALPAGLPMWFVGNHSIGTSVGKVAQWYRMEEVFPVSIARFTPPFEVLGDIRMTEIRSDRDGLPYDLLAKVRADGVVLVPRLC